MKKLKMKIAMKNKFLSLIAIVLAVASSLALTACDDDAPAGDMTVTYSVNLGEDMPRVGQVAIHYIDEAGKPQVDRVTGTSWSKAIKPHHGTGVFAVRIAVEPKNDAAKESYKLGAESLIKYAGANGAGANAKVIAPISQYDKSKLELVLARINSGYHAIRISNNGERVVTSDVVSPFGK